MSETPVPLSLTFDPPADAVADLSPLVRRIVAPNASPMTFTGTCTYLVGRGDVIVIDPGPEIPAHIEAILKATSGERLTHILVTHTHRDHSPGARLLKARTGAPIVGCEPYTPARRPHASEQTAVAASNDLDHAPDRVLTDGDEVHGSGVTLVAVSTPGHTMNHLAFALPEEGALFSGDHVMAWSTTIVSPPTGSMAAYMNSLDKLRSRQDRIYWPGHGGPVNEPQRYVRALQHHRRQRELAVLARLKHGAATADAIAASIYEGLDARLKRAAALSVLAHLEDLTARGRVISGDEPSLAAAFALAGPSA